MTGFFFIFVPISLTLFQGPPGRAGFPVIVLLCVCLCPCLGLLQSLVYFIEKLFNIW